MTPPSTLFITGAAGFIGSRVLQHLLNDPAPFTRIVATDISPFPKEIEDCDHIQTLHLDIRDKKAVRAAFEDARPHTVIHLAAIVTPPPGDQRRLQYEVDVLGTRHITQACVATGVERFIFTSSGAAYGYHPANRTPRQEQDKLHGNKAFAYAYHKRLVEEELAKLRQDHPNLRQLIFRTSTVLGPTTDNQITALFNQPIVTGIQGADSPFCIIADEDVVRAILHGITTQKSGIYNLTGDGILTLKEIARRMGNRYVALPEKVVQGALAILSRAKLSPYGPEQVLFLKYRPVLDNRRLKEEFGFIPTLTTDEAFERYRGKLISPWEQKTVFIAQISDPTRHALAIDYARQHWRVALADHDPQALERTYMQLRALGHQAIAIPADLSSPEDVDRARKKAQSLLGEISAEYPPISP